MNKYNLLPIAWREISNQEFTAAFMHYCLDPLEHRQMLYYQDGSKIGQLINANLFSIAGTKRQFPEDGLGVAIFRDGYECKFAKFGNDADWLKFESEFAAQFRGDNT